MPDYLTYYRRTRHPGYVPGVQPPIGGIPTSNLVLWLRSDQIVGLSDADPISTWPDLSGLGYDAVSSGTLRPLYKTSILNGHPAVRFDGSDDEMSIASVGTELSTDAHLFIVCSLNSESSYNVYNHGNVDSWWRYTDGDGYLGCFRTARINSYPATMPTTGNHRFELRSDGSNYEFFLDTVSKGAQAASFAAGTSHTIGRPDDSNAAKYFAGDIFEIILYSAIQSAGSISAINSYLASRYGL